MTATTSRGVVGFRQRARAWRGSIPERPARLLGIVGPALAVIIFQMALFPMKLGFVLQGATIGLLTALIAIGMAMIYRANRVLNFSQAEHSAQEAHQAPGLPAAVVVD